jgi:iron complex transport system ATP-binding protein
LNNALSAANVSFSYDGTDAVSADSLAVAPGEFISLIGPNGSGKTTLIRLLAGVIPPKSGAVSLFGRDLRLVPRREIARSIAVVPQETSSVFPFTVEEIVLMGRFPRLGPYGFETKADLDVARDAMRLTGTLDFAARPIDELSGGERQRVIIARALAQEARVLLLDEPTAYLDLKHQVEISALVKSLQRSQSLAVVAASHDVNLAAAFSDRLVLLKSGAVFAQGSPRDVVTPAVLSAAYEIEVTVGTLDGAPFVAPRLGGFPHPNGDAK